MMSKDVQVNDIIQLIEKAQEGWVACLMIVSEVRSWGVLAYTKVPCGGDAYLRVPFDQFEIVGRALLVHPDSLVQNVLDEEC
jgi:hypothetical protein